jgi:uncharacterized protein involved in type VI secretion and phage assembly
MTKNYSIDPSMMNGVIIGTVVSNEDPEGRGQVLVDIPWLEGRNQSYWASPATLMAGAGRGSWFMPEKGDEVLLAFDHCSVEHPYIIGFMWNGADKPPSNDPHLRLIHTVNGHEIAIYDPPISGGDRGYVRISDTHGNVIELSNAQIRIKGIATLTIDAPMVMINGRLVAPVSKPI